MTRTMYDGIPADVSAIHARFGDPSMVAGYVDGLFAWSQANWDTFPNAVHVRISAIPGSSEAMTADVADCETGDYDAQQAAAWAHAKKAAGYDRPTIYCSLSEAGAVRVATGSLILGVDYDLWIADYDGNPVQVVFSDGRKAAAKQYNSFSFYDISAVFDDSWPHRKAAPVVQGPFRQEVPAGNTASLDAIAAARNTTLAHIVAVSEQALDAVNMGILNAYVQLDSLCHASGHVQRPVAPTGMVYYTEHP